MSKQTIIQTEFVDDVQALVDAHLAAENAAAKNDDAMARIAQWIAAGVYPNNATIIAGYINAGKSKGSASVYASAILKWVKAGKVPKNIQAAVNTNPPGHVKGKAGRPVGQGKGKSTAPAADTAPVAEAPQAPQGDKAWKQVLEAMRAGVPARKDWASEDIVAFQDCAAKMIALIARNAK